MTIESLNPPAPVELTAEAADALRDLDASDDRSPSAYVLRHGQPTWVVVSCEGVIANVPESMIEPDGRGGFRAVLL
ncbi:hypothetical protein JNB62_13215 [Microbacterium jejuense]|uniref:Uncharacterized protein n=1 Tax=Microbacterium jejuense TaxID=1263637 RepID=A0ABS7HQF5_9MICO|nr:hypothetical protein [Microbacterium jejuense]MBW9094650.1 hypothetical protein [Microbacterium jejuense]